RRPRCAHLFAGHSIFVLAVRLCSYTLCSLLSFVPHELNIIREEALLPINHIAVCKRARASLPGAQASLPAMSAYWREQALACKPSLQARMPALPAISSCASTCLRLSPAPASLAAREDGSQRSPRS